MIDFLCQIGNFTNENVNIMKNSSITNIIIY